MEKLQEFFLGMIDRIPLQFKRYLWNNIDWQHRLIAIMGARGTGKTTFLLQSIKENHEISTPLRVMYASLDNLWFGSNSLFELAETFTRYGGKALFLDEVHKYPNWSRELKNVYDTFPDLKIVFTGSSLLDIYRGEADLSRRVARYEMTGMSFREYLNMTGHDLPGYDLEEILGNHISISRELNQKIEFPLLHFNEYIRKGYYPFFKEAGELYLNQLNQIVNTVLENDIPATHFVEYATIHKIKNLLNYLATSTPFKPNISKLSGLVGINRNQLVELIHLLDRAHLLNNLTAGSQKLSRLAKPEKIYLHNTNLYFAFGMNPDEGSIRETFFYNQLSGKHHITYPTKADFLVDDKFIFEVGGKGKDSKQIKNIKNSYIAADGIEYGIGNKIPLWLFGFLY